MDIEESPESQRRRYDAVVIGKVFVDINITIDMPRADVVALAQRAELALNTINCPGICAVVRKIIGAHSPYTFHPCGTTTYDLECGMKSALLRLDVSETKREVALLDNVIEDHGGGVHALAVVARDLVYAFSTRIEKPFSVAKPMLLNLSPVQLSWYCSCVLYENALLSGDDTDVKRDHIARAADIGHVGATTWHAVEFLDHKLVHSPYPARIMDMLSTANSKGDVDAKHRSILEWLNLTPPRTKLDVLHVTNELLACARCKPGIFLRLAYAYSLGALPGFDASHAASWVNAYFAAMPFPPDTFTRITFTRLPLATPSGTRQPDVFRDIVSRGIEQMISVDAGVSCDVTCHVDEAPPRVNPPKVKIICSAAVKVPVRMYIVPYVDIDPVAMLNTETDTIPPT